MASATSITPAHGRIRLGASSPGPEGDVAAPQDGLRDGQKKGSAGESSHHLSGDVPHSPSLLRLVHEKNLQQHVTPDTPQPRISSGGTEIAPIRVCHSLAARLGLFCCYFSLMGFVSRGTGYSLLSYIVFSLN